MVSWDIGMYEYYLRERDCGRITLGITEGIFDVGSGDTTLLRVVSLLFN